MGDLANMTSVHGEVSGQRLLRWLRSHAEMECRKVSECVARDDAIGAAQHRGMWSVLLYMQEDLERELTPPDYPEDGGDGRDNHVSDGLQACPDCGLLRIGKSTLGVRCLECTLKREREADGGTVDLDDPALTGGHG